MKLYPAHQPSPLRHCTTAEGTYEVPAAAASVAKPRRSKKPRQVSYWENDAVLQSLQRARRVFLSRHLPGPPRDIFHIRDLSQSPNQSDAFKRGLLRDGLVLEFFREPTMLPIPSTMVSLGTVAASVLHGVCTLPSLQRSSEQRHLQLLHAKAHQAHFLLTSALRKLQDWKTREEPAYSTRVRLEVVCEQLSIRSLERARSLLDQPEKLEILVEYVDGFQGSLISLPAEHMPVLIIADSDAFCEQFTDTIEQTRLSIARRKEMRRLRAAMEDELA